MIVQKNTLIFPIIDFVRLQISGYHNLARVRRNFKLITANKKVTMIGKISL